MTLPFRTILTLSLILGGCFSKENDDDDNDWGDDSGWGGEDRWPDGDGDDTGGGGGGGGGGDDDSKPSDCASEDELYRLTEGSCGPTGELEFTTTLEMEAFCDEYRAVNGNVTITGPDVTTLDALSCLCGVDGQLSLTDSAVTSFRGLASLESVQRLVIENNFYLEQIAPNIALEIDYLEIAMNLFVSEMDFAPGTQINNVVVSDNNSLRAVELAGMVGQNPVVRITSNDALETIDLTGMRKVNGLRISGNDALQSVMVPNLEAIQAELSIRSNPELTSFQMPSLQSMTCGEWGHDCAGSDASICFANNDSMLEVNLSASLSVTSNDGESGDKCGFGFNSNESLVSVDLSGISGETGSVSFEDNPLLRTIDFSGITATESLYISYLPLLDSADFGSVEDIDGNLSVYHSGGNHLDLGALRNVHSGVTMRNLSELRNVDGLHDLQIIGGTLRIEDNQQLSDLDGLHNVERIGGDLNITDNRELSTSEANQLRNAIGSANIAGEVNIEGNGWSGGDDTGE